MKKATKLLALTAAFCLICLSLAIAQDDKGTPQSGMPPMGPPAQMKQLDFLIGTWDVAMKMKMTPQDTGWMDSPGTATYEYILGGAVQQSKYSSTMMGMPFEGLMLEGYNTDLGKWQAVWTDNMGGRLSLYTGSRAGDSTVLMGSEVYMGQEMHTRIVTLNQTPTSFDWRMETSTDGGKTYALMATATYTKRK